MCRFRGPRNRLFIGSHPFTDPRCLMAKTHAYDLFREYNEQYRNEPFYGTYAYMNYPILIIRDLDLAKRIMCKIDFSKLNKQNFIVHTEVLQRVNS